jgi:hypothetical protein
VWNFGKLDETAGGKICGRMPAQVMENLLWLYTELRLSLLGWTQEEISDKLKELWPQAKGTTQRAISHLLDENGNLPLSSKILDDLKAGHSVATVAKRMELPDMPCLGAVVFISCFSSKNRPNREILTSPFDQART